MMMGTIMFTFNFNNFDTLSRACVCSDVTSCLHIGFLCIVFWNLGIFKITFSHEGAGKGGVEAIFRTACSFQKD